MSDCPPTREAPTREELQAAVIAAMRDTLNQASRMAEYANSFYLDRLYERAAKLEWLSESIVGLLEDRDRLKWIRDNVVCGLTERADEDMPALWSLWTPFKKGDQYPSDFLDASIDAARTASLPEDSANG
jgi:hypothetical protein